MNLGEDVARIYELIESGLATPAPWQEACLRECCHRAAAAGLSLPSRLRFCWRRGTGRLGVQGATAHEAGGSIVVYVSVAALDLRRTTYHELFHVRCILTGASQRISLDQEEEQAAEFASRMTAPGVMRR